MLEGRGNQQSRAEAISRGNQQKQSAEAIGCGISRFAWSSLRRGRSALPCLPNSSRGERRPGSAAAAGVAARVRNRRAGPGTRAGPRGGGARQGGRLGGAASAGRRGSSPPCGRPTFVAAEQPQVGYGAGGRRRRWSPALSTAAAGGGCRRWL